VLGGNDLLGSLLGAGLLGSLLGNLGLLGNDLLGDLLGGSLLGVSSSDFAGYKMIIN
jgi:hypothetical protein